MQDIPTESIQPPTTGDNAELMFTADKLNSEQKGELWGQVDKHRKMFREKLCFHPGNDHSPDIGNCHSIQESKLRLIADHGHVYSHEQDPAAPLKSLDFRFPWRRGVDKVSVFHGFCAKHDDQLFRPIETLDFRCTPEQLFLYFYRAICRELHVRRCAAKAHVGANDVARMHPELSRDVYEDSVGRQQAHSISEALKLYLYKSAVDSVLMNAEFRRLKHFVIVFKHCPTVLAAGATTPTCDFHGTGFRLISHPLLPYPILTATTIPTASGGAFILSWFDNAPTEFDRFCSSLGQVSPATLTSAVIRFLFEFCDNIALAPAWWDSLPERHRVRLIDHARSGVTLRRTNECLVDDGLRYGDWEPETRFQL